MNIKKLSMFFTATIVILLLLSQFGVCGQVKSREKSLIDSVYSLTIQSKKFVEADFLDSALFTAYLADTITMSIDNVHDTVKAAVLNNLGYCMYRTQKFENCLNYLDSAKALIMALNKKDDSLIADIYGNYGRLYDGLGEYKKSIENYLKALHIQEIVLGPNHIEVGTTTNNLAVAKLKMGEYKDAEQLFKRTLDNWISNLGPEHPDVGLCYLNLGYLYDDLGKYYKAEEYYYKALRNRTKALGPNHSSIGLISLNISAVQLVLGRVDSSLFYIKTAQRIIKESFGEKNNVYPLILSTLGKLYNIKGDMIKSERFYKKSLSLYSSIYSSDNPELLTLYGQLSSYYSEIGKYEEALNYTKRINKISKNVFGEYSVENLYSIANLAELFYRTKQFDKVDSLYDEYKEVISKCDSSNYYSYYQSLAIFGAVLLNVERCDAGTELLKEFYTRDKVNNRSDYNIEVMLTMGYLCNGEEVNAREYAKKAEESLFRFINSKNFGPPNYSLVGNCFDLLGNSYLFLGNEKKAIEYLKKSFFYSTQFLKYVFTNASQATKSFLLTNTQFYSFSPDLFKRINKKQMYEFGLKSKMVEKSFVIDAISAEHEFFSRSEDKLTKELLEKYSYLSSQTASLIRSREQTDVQTIPMDSIKVLINERDSLELLINNTSGIQNLSTNDINFKLEDIAHVLKDDEILIEYFSFKKSDILKNEFLVLDSDYYYGAYILDSKNNISFYDLGSKNKIDSLIKKHLIQIENTSAKAYSSIGSVVEEKLFDETKELYNKIISPFAHLLKDKKSLIISPVDNLNLVLFDALPLENDRYFIEKYKTSYVSSGKDLLKRRNNDSINTGPVVLFSDPNYDLDLYPKQIANNFQEQDTSSRTFSFINEIQRSGDCGLTKFSQLPYTSTETDSIQELFKKKDNLSISLFQKNEARESKLKNLSRVPSVLHLATHGFVCSDKIPNISLKYYAPMFQSGLALAGANSKTNTELEEPQTSFEDGLLTAYEASSLNLIGTDLVVLSACETGVGEYINGMGVMGLRSSFRQAGAKSVIMSLWKIPDQLSSVYMQGFYKRWLSGESKIDALRNTSLDLLANARKKYGNGHPIFWSGFILAGETR